MLSGVNRNIEIAIGLGGADPVAVQRPFRGGPGARFEDFVFLEEVNERFAGFQLTGWMARAA